MQANASLRPTVFFVVGMHRSGTSVIAATLGAMGVELGDDLLLGPPQFNPMGYFEDVGLLAVSDRLLTAGNATWHTLWPDDPEVCRPDRYRELLADAVRIFQRRFGQSQRWALKNPRILRQLAFWRQVAHQAGHDARFLVCLRHPYAVAGSLARRDDMHRSHALRLWLLHMLSASDLVLHDAAVVVEFDRLIDAPVESIETLGRELGLDVDSSSTALQRHVAEMLTPSLRHHDARPPADVTRDAELGGCCLALYECLARVQQDRSQGSMDGLALAQQNASQWLARERQDTQGVHGPAPQQSVVTGSIRHDGESTSADTSGMKMKQPDLVYASVAVITRTRDRPVTLERVLRTLQAQTSRDFVWVLVNDGGELRPVERIASAARDSGVGTVLVHHPESKGRSAAANAGIAAADSRYIVWLDDDDSWHPQFLARALEFLETRRDRFKAVVTGCEVVLEKFAGDGVSEVKREPYPPPDSGDSVSIITMMVGNPFPPVSFVFDREICNACGGFDETIDYWEDWEFNTRFILRGEIGVLPDILAYYHVRVDSDAEAYKNTETYRYSGPLYNAQAWQDQELRTAVQSGRLDRGLLLYLGRMGRDADALNERFTVTEHHLHVLEEQLKGSEHALAVLREASRGVDYQLSVLQEHAKGLANGHLVTQQQLGEIRSLQDEIIATQADLQRMLRPLHDVAASGYRFTGLRWLAGLIRRLRSRSGTSPTNLQNHRRRGS